MTQLALGSAGGTAVIQGAGVLTYPDLPGITVTIEWVTPEQAEAWLKESDAKAHNRNLRLERAEAYAEDMAHDWWRFNGETIIFDREGVCVDGQHRLKGIVLADREVLMLVVRGVESEAIHTIDMGVARRYADVLKMRGEQAKNVQAASTMERRLFMWKRRGKKTNRNGRTVDKQGMRLPPPTVTELLEFREEYLPLLKLALARGLDTRKWIKKVSAPTLATAYFVFKELDDRAADKFFDLLMQGVGFGDDVHHPVKVLRDRLLDGDALLAARRTTEDEKLALICRAWNHFRAGTPVQRLYVTLNKQPLSDDNFPEPK